MVVGLVLAYCLGGGSLLGSGGSSGRRLFTVAILMMQASWGSSLWSLSSRLLSSLSSELGGGGRAGNVVSQMA